jgi:two-component system OmpR family sensor kinase
VSADHDHAALRRGAPPSIRRRLLAWLAGALFAGALLIALATYLFSLEEMNEVLDEQLHQVALTVLAHYQGGAPARPVPAVKRSRSADDDEDLEGLDFVTQVWTRAGERVFVSQPDITLPLSRVEGFQTVITPGGAWRVYTDRSANYYTQAAQATQVRERLAAEVALKILVPSLAAVPLLSLLLMLALRRGLEPLTRTALDVGRRSAASLEPIDTAPLPAELEPLVAAINALMAQLSRAIGAQRRFTADAAHELRTPLAALRLQLQLAADARDAAQRGEALADARLGLARATRLVEQLLQLARVEPEELPLRRARVDLAALAKTVVADFSARADALGIDLGAAIEPAPADLAVLGDEQQLRALLDNLVDNALRYTPRGGKVDVRVDAAARGDEVDIEVRDSGPGIAEAERELVFRRFYRAGAPRADAASPPGAGLGLAIVDAVAHAHAARVELSAGFAREGSPGLGVRVSFPRHTSDASQRP